MAHYVHIGLDDVGRHASEVLNLVKMTSHFSFGYFSAKILGSVMCKTTSDVRFSVGKDAIRASAYFYSK